MTATKQSLLEYGYGTMPYILIIFLLYSNFHYTYSTAEHRLFSITKVYCFYLKYIQYNSDAFYQDN